MVEIPENRDETAGEPSGEPVGDTKVASQGGARSFSLWQRVQISLASWTGSFLVSLVGCTLRWKVFGWENWEAARQMGEGVDLYLLAPRDFFRDLVLAKARHRGHDQPEFRWRNHRSDNPEARLWRGAGIEFARRYPRPRGNDSLPATRLGCGVYH